MNTFRSIHPIKMKSVQTIFRPVSFFTLYLLTVSFVLFERLRIPQIGMSPYRLLAGLLVIIMFIEMLKNRRIHLTREIIFFILLLWSTSLIGLEERNLLTFLTYFFLTCLLVVLYNLLYETGFDKRMIIHLSILSTFVMLVGSLTLLTDYFGITKFTLLFGEEIYKEVVLHGRGAGILGGETNFSASRICTLLPFSFYLLLHVKEKRMGLKPFIAVSIVFAIIAVVLTGSRMGLLVLGQMILVIGITELRGKKILGKFGIIIGVAAIIITLSFSMKLMKNQAINLARFQNLAAVSELASVQYEESNVDDSILNRFMLFWIGTDLIRKNTLFGVGIGNAKYLTVKYFPFDDQMKHLHNTYLDIGAENGIVMLVFLLIFIAGILISNYKIYRKTGDHFYFYFLFSFYILLFCWLFLSDFSNKLFWNLFLPLGLFFKNRDLTKKA